MPDDLKPEAHGAVALDELALEAATEAMVGIGFDNYPRFRRQEFKVDVETAIRAYLSHAPQPEWREIAQKLVSGWEKAEPDVNNAFIMQHTRGGGGYSGPKDFADALAEARAMLAAAPPPPRQDGEG